MTEKLQPPGQPGGPCLDGCTHEECDAARTKAAQACIACGKPIGYQKRFYGCLLEGLVHEDCNEKP